MLRRLPVPRVLRKLPLLRKLRNIFPLSSMVAPTNRRHPKYGRAFGR